MTLCLIATVDGLSQGSLFLKLCHNSLKFDYIFPENLGFLLIARRSWVSNTMPDTRSKRYFTDDDSYPRTRSANRAFVA